VSAAEPASYLYTLVALTVVLAMLVGVLVATVLRFSAAAREARRPAAEQHSEGAFVMGAMKDALDRLRVQERILHERAEASQRLNDTIVAGLTSGLLLVDAQGVLRIANPAGRRLLGLGEGVGDRSYREVLADAEPLVSVVGEGLRSPVPIERRLVSVRIGSPAGATASRAERHFGVTVSPLHGPDGAPQGVICLFTDLTSVVALEQQVQFKESLARLGELTAGLAHEFRNGLATIHGYARLLDPARLGPPHDAYVRALREETETLNDVVTNFLAFARPTPLVASPVDVGQVALRVAEDFTTEAGRLDGAVVTRGTFGHILGDEVLLRQAVGNLCRNALEACAASRVGPQIVIEGALDRGAGALVLTVRDNGPGIPADHLERVFQPFFTTKPSGTGLGLALVQKIVVTHNGHVAARNLPEGGAAFDVRLPVNTAA
jgi:signal transduction histidine kinase